MEFPEHHWDQMSQGMLLIRLTVAAEPRTDVVSSIAARDLCGDMLVYEPLERATVQQALRHTWFSAELLDLELAYRSRIGSG